MAKRVLPLKDTDIRKAKPHDGKQRVLRDGEGLILVVTKTGKKIWRLKYRYNNKENTISLGEYPQVSLSKARDKKTEYREMIKNNIDPAAHKKKIKLKKNIANNNTFKKNALDYLTRQDNLNKAYKDRLHRILEKDFFPFLQSKDIDEIKPLEMLDIIKRIETRGATESAHRCFSFIDRIYRYSVTTGRAKHNIMADIDKNIALKSHTSKHLPHIDNEKEFAILLQLIEEYRGDFATKQALRLAPYVFVRPFNLRFAEWKEINLKNKTWKIPPEKMKIKLTHITTLTDSMLAIIEDTHSFSAHRSKYLFPSPTNVNKPMSDNTLNFALKRLGYSGVMTAHGFRHTASTLLHENMHKHGVHSDAIEMQMAHSDGSIKGIYNHAKYLEERSRLMQWWSDYIDQLRSF